MAEADLSRNYLVYSEHHILLDQRHHDDNPSYQVSKGVQTIILRSSRGRLVPYISNWNGNVADRDDVVRYPLLWCKICFLACEELS
jgi:hypothetical protein